MLWDAAETALRSHVETQWAAGAYATTQLIWDQDHHGDKDVTGGPFMWISIEGTYSSKGIFGGSGKRLSVEGGVVLFSAFVPTGTGKSTANSMVQTMTTALELQLVSTSIYCEDGNPPSPADPTDVSIPGGQPGGMYYRVSGSVPFIITGAR